MATTMTTSEWAASDWAARLVFRVFYRERRRYERRKKYEAELEAAYQQWRAKRGTA
jgi:hypothetical protein